MKEPTQETSRSGGTKKNSEIYVQEGTFVKIDGERRVFIMVQLHPKGGAAFHQYRDTLKRERN